MTSTFSKFCGLIFAGVFFTATALADLPLADGGASGQWWNPDRNGEGLFVEILPNSAIAIAWFTYDDAGNQLWLSGQAALGAEDTTVNVPVIVTDGPFFGPAYDPDDLNVETWGTVALQFHTCDTGLLSYSSSVGMGDGSIDISRLTSIDMVTCNEPPETEKLPPGKWEAPGVCLFVSLDGRTITSDGSTCPGGKAFTATFDGFDLDGNPGSCSVNAECSGTWAIREDGSFECGGVNGFAAGEFQITQEGQEFAADGVAGDRSGAAGLCFAAWVATPLGLPGE